MRFLLLAVAVAGLFGGPICQFLLADPRLAAWLFMEDALPVLVVLIWELANGLMYGNLGRDIMAALSLSATLIFGEHMAAAIIALMYARGAVSGYLCQRSGPARDDGVAVTGAQNRDVI